MNWILKGVSNINLMIEDCYRFSF